MNKRKMILKMISVFFFIISIVSVVTGCSTKEYNINEANFLINLDNEGNANITEKWVVTYKGNYSRFYKENYYHKLPETEFYNFNYNYSKINNQTIDLISEIKEDLNNEFFIKSTIDGYQFEWYYKAKDETVIYEVNYDLNDVVKELNGKKAIFINRLIGLEFEKEINKISIEITGDNIDGIKVKNITNKKNFNIEEKNNSIIINNVKSHEGLLKIYLELDKDNFNNIPIIEKIDRESKYVNTFDDYSGYLIYIFLIVPLAGSIISKLITRKREKRLQNMLIKNPHYFEDCLNLIEDTNASILIKYSLKDKENVNSTRKIMQFLMSMKQKDVLGIKENIIVINNNYKDILLFKDALALEGIFDIFGYHENDGCLVLNMEKFSHVMIGTDPDSKEIKKQIEKILTCLENYYEKEIVNKEIEKAFEFISWFIKKYNKRKTIKNGDTINYLREGISFEELVLYSYSLCWIDTVSDNYIKLDCERIAAIFSGIITDLDLEIIFDNIDDFYEETGYSSSDFSISSDSSSGWSCSSCSGCGGGGAD